MRRTIFGTLTFLALASASPADISAQLGVELYGSAGFNLVDVDAWAGQTALDWNTLVSGGHAQLFFAGAGPAPVKFGVEVGYEYLLFYQIAFGGTTVDRNVDANRVMGVIRASLPGTSVFVEGAAGAYFFGDFTDFAVAGGIGTHVSVAPTISIPLKLRTHLIMDPDTQMIPVIASAGVAFSLGG